MFYVIFNNEGSTNYENQVVRNMFAADDAAAGRNTDVIFEGVEVFINYRELENPEWVDVKRYAEKGKIMVYKVTVDGAAAAADGYTDFVIAAALRYVPAPQSEFTNGKLRPVRASDYFIMKTAASAASAVSNQPIVSKGVNPQPTGGVAQQSTQSAKIGDKPVELQAYKLVDSTGDTNYVKIRDIAAALDGTAAQFDVQWDGAINLVTGVAYTSRNGQENKTPYSGNQTYTKSTAVTKINGKEIELQAFVLKDANGGESTYYKLRDIGQALGFNVGWNEARGMYIEPDRPYTDAD